jgi:hypothetical protein
MGGGRRTVSLPLKVTAVLPKGSPSSNVLFVPVVVLESFEDFTEGRSAPRYGWYGEPDALVPFFDSLMVFSCEEVTADELPKLVPGAGYSTSTPLDPVDYFPFPLVARLRAANFASILADPTSPPVFPMERAEWKQLVLRTDLDSDAGYDRVARVDDVLSDHRPRVLVPVNLPFEARLEPLSGPALALGGIAYTLPDLASALLAMDPIFPWVPLRNDVKDGMSLPPLRMVAVAPEVAEEFGTQARLVGGLLACPVTLVSMAGLNRGSFLLPSSLSGTYRAARRTAAEFDSRSGMIVLARNSHARFRLYAATLEGVETLQRSLEAEGFEVESQLEAVRNVQFWDARLGILLKMSMYVLGGAAVLSLMASLIGSVERKRYDLAVLQMIGMPRFWVAAIPVAQSVILCAAAYAGSLLVVSGFSTVVNRLFSERLESGEQLVQIAGGECAIGLIAIIALATAAAAAAAGRTMLISPGEALRAE